MKNMKIESNKAFIFNSPNWIKGRENYIGGSDSYAFGAEILAQKYRFNTRFTVWCEKSGFGIKKTGPYIKYGIYREPRILQKASSLIICQLGLKNEVFESVDTYLMRDYPFIGANLDGIVRLENGALAGLEIKTSSHPEGWSDSQIPWIYWNQVQHYMLVTGLKQFFVIAEVCDKTLVIRIEADSVYQEELLQKMIAFWFFVQTKEQPEPAYVLCEKPYLKKIKMIQANQYKHISSSYKTQNSIENTIEMPELGLCLEEFNILERIIKICKQRLKNITNHLKENIKPGYQVHAGNYQVSLSLGTYQSLDYKNLKENEPQIYQKFLKKWNREILCVRELSPGSLSYSLHTDEKG